MFLTFCCKTYFQNFDEDRYAHIFWKTPSPTIMFAKCVSSLSPLSPEASNMSIDMSSMVYHLCYHHTVHLCIHAIYIIHSLVPLRCCHHCLQCTWSYLHFSLCQSDHGVYLMRLICCVELLNNLILFSKHIFLGRLTILSDFCVQSIVFFSI